jgi:AcrR family transcriptional regulator
MCQTSRVAADPDRTDEQRRQVVHEAAVRVFSERGFADTSMAAIAEAAGMSRPALYLSFKNKQDIFASAFAALIEASVDRALEALSAPGTTEQRLAGFLQRFDGDLWQQMSASPHADELLDAKFQHAAEAASRGVQRLHDGLAAHLRRTGAPRARRAEWAELLLLSPKGFKVDEPTVAVYRRRLDALARGVAADIDALAR